MSRSMKRIPTEDKVRLVEKLKGEISIAHAAKGVSVKPCTITL